MSSPELKQNATSNQNFERNFNNIGYVFFMSLKLAKTQIFPPGIRKTCHVPAPSGTSGSVLASTLSPIHIRTGRRTFGKAEALGRSKIDLY